MKKLNEITEKVQGTETVNKDERKIQISMKMLKELANDGKLLKHFTETIDRNPDMKAPIAYQFAKAIIKQLTFFEDDSLFEAEQQYKKNEK